MQELSEAKLLGLMSAQRRDPSAARAAWGELYRRHCRYVLRVVSRGFGHRFEDEEVSDLAADAFQAAFDWAGKQPSPEGVVARFDGPDHDGIRRRVLGWLAVTARRLALRRLANQGEGMVPLRDDVCSAVEPEDPQPTHLRARLASALKRLSAGEVEALRVSSLWYDPVTGEFGLPRGEAARLASSLGITVEALRQRRHRALQKLKSDCAEAARTVSLPVLVHVPRKISRSMKEADDLDVASGRPVDDQVVRKLARSPGSNAVGACRAELPRAAGEGVLEQEADGITDRVQQPLGRLGRVRADVEVGLREVLLGDRAPDRASAQARAFTVPSAASSACS